MAQLYPSFSGLAMSSFPTYITDRWVFLSAFRALGWVYVRKLW